ncbi:MAG: Ig-like domain-containing protein, partial [Clostridia bacterium]|nr:Ig-like domain-containing protein [Clostridia bacterium]
MVFVDSVRVLPQVVNLQVGRWYYGAVAEVCPENATCNCVTWYSDNTSVATVGPDNGFIYAKAPGIARIYATAADAFGASDYMTVTVSGTIAVESITLDPASISLEVGTSADLCAAVCPGNSTNKNLHWSSSNTNVATVEDGEVSAIARGSATITAVSTDGSGVSGSCTVNVTGDILVSSIQVCPMTATLFKGESTYVSASVSPSNAATQTVTWRSSNSNVATVNPDTGLVIAKNAGTVMIYAAAQDGSGVEGCCTIRVRNPILVENITLNETFLELEKEESFTLSATVCPSNAKQKKVCWSSSNTAVATVDGTTGKVTGKNVGNATIYAAAVDDSGVCASCSVRVNGTTTTPTCPQNENTAPENTYQDPIDVYNGAHLLQNTLMTLFGGQGLKLTAHYDSTRLVESSLGRGWYHNYEKYVVVDGSEAYAYQNPSVFLKYEKEAGSNGVFNCIHANKAGYVLTVDHTRAYPYIIDCNSAHTEYYNAEGKLAKIVDHQGFETQITYSGTLITIADCVSGKKMYLAKDAEGKIVRVYDDASRQATITYSGDLITAICDVNGNSLSY